MRLRMDIRNESARKRLYRRDALDRIACGVLEGEGLAKRFGEIEVSVLFCDDPAIRELNRLYRGKDSATDVLSFEQDGPGAVRVLGDIVISLETVENRFPGDGAAQRAEVRMLFCHGMLHLVGYDHQSEAEQTRMAEKQAHYLNVPLDQAWPVEA